MNATHYIHKFDLVLIALKLTDKEPSYNGYLPYDWWELTIRYHETNLQTKETKKR